MTMTEAEWQSSSHPLSMLQHLSATPRELAAARDDRKLRLLACSTARHVWPWLEDPRNLSAVEAIEQFADRRISAQQLTAIERHASNPWSAGFLTASLPGWSLAVGTVIAAEREIGPDDSKVFADFLRCLFGNPFRPVAVDPAWLAWNHATVPAIARHVYDDRAFHDLPILADALEDAGCTDPDLLAHCRGPGPHVRGCWAVDLLLGKS